MINYFVALATYRHYEFAFLLLLKQGAKKEDFHNVVLDKAGLISFILSISQVQLSYTFLFYLFCAFWSSKSAPAAAHAQIYLRICIGTVFQNKIILAN